ncbi:Hypothetical protein PHPALM_8787 [Phytophthora palmivora]|uniref:Uncharacterized protein n=1 Tax=Phytophthora palmivora TaxID=4796 RepID=A0A2P4Y902_9STRA|nr:Hypothetical protein PHPALM_8787 [Phytophthora palmivora]
MAPANAALLSCSDVSDLTQSQKASRSIGVEKSSSCDSFGSKPLKNQILSLFLDDDCTTCPMLAFALALVTQSSTIVSFVRQLTKQ